MPEPNSGCWIWIGADNGNGYGRITVNYKNDYPHRVLYKLLVGPIPEGLTIDHLCRNRACVNPAHMEPVTQTENKLRGESPPALNARKTHCPRGHLYDEKNTYIDKQGYRHCRACRRKG